MKKHICLIFLFVLMMPSLSHARLITAGRTMGADIPVYETATLDEPFEVIGKVSVTAAMANGLVDAIRKEARSQGGDAVLNYKVLRQGTLPSVGATDQATTAQVKTSDLEQSMSAKTTGYNVGEQNWPMAEGIVVRFSKTGVKAIGAETKVPVL